MDLKENLFNLSRLDAVGTITDAANYAEKELSKYVKTERLSALTTIGKIEGKSDYTLMLDAHIDQVAMIVTDISDNGFLTLSKCGGFDIKTLPSRPVTVHGKRPVKAVFCSTPPHLSSEKKEYKDLTELKVDTLLGEKAKEIISIGDYVTYSVEPVELFGNRITGKSLDDRTGVACLLELAKRLSKKELPISVAFLISDMEELGLRGAKTATYKLNPNEAISIDVSFGDGPDISPEECGKLGKGAMIGFSPVLDSKISKRLVSIGKENNLNFQTEVMGGSTSTNADVISITKEGVRTGLLSIPLRNMHTEVEVVSIDDVLCVCDMLEAYILSGGVMNDRAY